MWTSKLLGVMRSVRTIAFVVAIAAVQGACSKPETLPRHRDAGPFMPETIGALSLEDPEAFPPAFREAARVASLYFSQRGERPDLRFAQVVVRRPDDIELSVWPAAAFSPHGMVRAAGGDGITLHYNPKTHRIERALHWQ